MKNRCGFTLVEILVVVIILGVLAAIVIPQVSTASTAARASMLADDMHTARTQTEVFKGQHLGVPPGYPDLDQGQPPTEQAFLDHMTQATTAEGDVAAPGTAGYRYGPYMTPFPTNPINGLATVQIIPDGQDMPAAADDSHGWVFKPATMTLRADATGTDAANRSYYDY